MIELKFLKKVELNWDIGHMVTNLLTPLPGAWLITDYLMEILYQLLGEPALVLIQHRQ